MSETEIAHYFHFDNQYESLLAMPNFIIDELVKLAKTNTIKPTHIGFTWTFLYIETWLYRYAKYSKVVPTYADIKKLLGYSPTNQRLDYIIKKDGLLDSINLTITTNDFPINISWSEKLIIDTLSEFDKEYVIKFRESNNISISQVCKYPVYAYDREYEGGSFYDSSNTTLVDFNVFAFCMSKEDLGCTAFYLYNLIKHKNDVLNSYDATYGRISNESGLSTRTTQRYMENMRAYKMINTIHNMDYFSPCVSKEERLASSHFVNEYEQFSHIKVEYDKLKFSNTTKKDDVNVWEYDLF